MQSFRTLFGIWTSTPVAISSANITGNLRNI